MFKKVNVPAFQCKFLTNTLNFLRFFQLYEECSNPNPVLGEAIAQFAFDGAQDGTIRMEANEKLWLIEKDEGDGWTRVRK